MKWVRDRTGRFGQRPHYDPEELDAECESIVSAFLLERHGQIRYPLTNDDLTLLVERRTSDLDPYADLSDRGEDVEGVTVFVKGARPSVMIARHLAEQHWSTNRFRTTVTHELGHVVFHDCLYQVDAERLELFPANVANPPPQPECKRDTIQPTSNVDWMEWQAGYACGAFLIPRTAVTRIVTDLRCRAGLSAAPGTVSKEGLAVVDAVAEAFHASRDAARVRLIQLKHVATQ